jgi:hypothetical protein
VNDTTSEAGLRGPNAETGLRGPNAETGLAAYVDAVAAHLARAPQLTDAERRELLDDLATHLTEVAAEHEGGSLEDRLGPPADYAREMLASAGVDTAAAGPVGAADWVRRWAARHLGELATGRGSPGPSARLEAAVRRTARELSERPWIRALLNEVPGLTPVWWALRGWLLAWVLAELTSSGYYRTVLFPFLPPVFGSALVGLVTAALFVLLSLREGRQNRAAGGATGVRRWVRWGVAVVCLIGAVAMPDRMQPPLYNSAGTTFAPAPPCLNHAGDPITDVHPYDRDGRPLADVRLYDQNGRPLVPCGLGTPSISALGPVPVPLTSILPPSPPVPTEPPLPPTTTTSTAPTSTTGP